MTFTEAAVEVLRLVGKPLHYKDITDIAIQRNLLSHVGKSPDVTMGARLAALLKKAPKDNPLVRTKSGVFALRAWEDGGPPGPAAEASGAVALPSGGDLRAESGGEEPSPESGDDVLVTASDQAERAAIEDDERLPPAPDEQLRANLASAATEVFDEEEDDDKPILGGDEPASDGGARRGRRRRGRRRGERGEAAPAEGSEGLPSYTVSPAFDGGTAKSPEDAGDDQPRDEAADGADAREPRERREREPREARDIEDMVGRDLSDLVAWLLGGFDRNGGPVALQKLADAAVRKNRLTGDVQLIAAQLAAAARADNARRAVEGRRARFRLSAGRIAHADWGIPGELVRLEREAQTAIDRCRAEAKKSLARRIGELHGAGLVELTLSLLERHGVSQVKSVRRPGGSGHEALFSATLKGAGGELPIGIVIRKDRGELSRERVIEARGSAHHFGDPAQLWLVTAGQSLSGAREEAGAVGALPVSILDGQALAKACEESGIGVTRVAFTVTWPDVELFESMRA